MRDDDDYKTIRQDNILHKSNTRKVLIIVIMFGICFYMRVNIVRMYHHPSFATMLSWNDAR